MHHTGGAAARIVVIPTAHIETEDRAAIEQFGENTARIFGVRNVSVLHTFSRREADSEAFVKPLQTASESVSGNNADTSAPTYGTMRISAATAPHNAAYGTPMKYKPIPQRTPKQAFTTNCMRR